jgi:hypothetical protein
VACGGGGTEAPLPVPLRAEAERQVMDGAALLTTTVTVAFAEEVTTASLRSPLSTYFHLSIESPLVADGRATVAVRSARVEGERLVLTVALPVPDGSELVIDGRLFREGATDDIAVKVESDLTPLQATLAATALAPLDPAIVTAGDPPPPGEHDENPAAMREALLEHLRTRGSGEEVIERAALTYDSISPEVVPSAKLRAVLAALTGTFAEPAVVSYLTDANCTGQAAALIAFQEPPDAPGLLARVTYDDAGRRIVSINPSVAGERIEHLMPLLAHEAIHCDREDGLVEEIAATAFDSFLYLQLLAVQPELAIAGTPLCQNMNIDAIALINSGRRLPESIGVLQSAGVRQAFPGTDSEAVAFADYVAAAYSTIDEVESPPEALAEAYAAILAGAYGMAPGSAFDLAYLDELLGRAMDIRVLAAVIGALRLGPGS